MSNRAVAPVFAVLLSSLASMALTTSTIAAPAADDQTETAAAAPTDDCLSSPKTETPKGSHWFYRLEKGTKRKCWYLGDAASKATKASTATTAAPRTPEPDAAKKPTAMQPVVANARAEMTAAQPAAAEDTKLNESIWPPLPDQSANAVSNDASEADSAPADAGQQTTAASANAQNWNISQRWPDQNPAATSGSSNDKARPSATPAAQSSSTPPTSTTDKTTVAVANRGILSNTTPMLIIMLAGALIFAAIAGRMIIKYASRGSQKTRGQRRDIWGDYKPDESASEAAFESPPPWTDFDERPLRPANDPSDEIEKLLSRAAKRSAA